MKRRIIEIDREKCNGCGACAEACHEGAIAMVDGKAQLMRDDYANDRRNGFGGSDYSCKCHCCTQGAKSSCPLLPL